MRVFLYSVGFALAVAGPALAEPEAQFTRLDPEGECVWDSLDHLSEAQKEEMLGNSAVCDGLPGYPVHFSEYDLRQFAAFGEVGPDHRTPGGYSQFNRTGDTIEWRLDSGRPYAAILRWFVENPDDEGATDKKREGQVLVVSTVANPDNPRSCPAGYVDARANDNPNMLAREIADTVAKSFRCGMDLPRFHGVRGPDSGDPVELAE